MNFEHQRQFQQSRLLARITFPTSESSLGKRLDFIAKMNVYTNFGRRGSTRAELFHHVQEDAWEKK